jgi:hypothetical protein
MTRPDVPKAISVQEGRPITLPILANGPGGLVYEWHKNGERTPSHSNAILSLEKVSPADAGRYHCVVRNRYGVAKSQEFDVQMARRPSLSNLSVRTRLGSSSEHIILGAVVRGGHRTMLARVAGPALNQFGLEGMGDPSFETLAESGSLLTSNNDWHGSLSSAFSAVGAFPFAVGSRDAASTFSTVGSFTVRARGTGAGFVLVEVYDSDVIGDSRLINVSARYKVGTGPDVLIAGFTVRGCRVLTRS